MLPNTMSSKLLLLGKQVKQIKQIKLKPVNNEFLLYYCKKKLAPGREKKAGGFK